MLFCCPSLNDTFEDNWDKDSGVGSKIDDSCVRHTNGRLPSAVAALFMFTLPRAADLRARLLREFRVDIACWAAIKMLQYRFYLELFFSLYQLIN